MDRKALREFTHSSKNFLSVEDHGYKQWVFRYTFLELEKDLGALGDVSTRSIFPKPREVNASIFVRQDGVIAGLEEVKYFLVDSDANFRPKIKGDFKIEFLVEDGAQVSSDTEILRISGDVHDLLAVERTVLNLLMRMSGVATFARSVVDQVADYDVLITPTRKTLWGHLDKKAVLLGGGGTHRLNLSDSVIIKDTHLNILNRDFARVLDDIAQSSVDCRFVEVEVENSDEVLKVAREFERVRLNSVGVIMMDNMQPSEVSAALAEVKSAGLYDGLLFEASGGINEKNVLEYAKIGVDIISMGCLTNGVRSLDMGMES